MARPRKSIPSYLPHTSGQARAVWTDRTGTRHFRMLPGPFNSPKSRTAFGTLLLEIEAGAKITAAPSPTGLSLAELMLAFLEHAERHYRKPDGRSTSELAECKLMARALREQYTNLPAAEFGPLKLKAVRQGWVNRGLSRSECNRRANLVRRMFKWAAGEELVDESVHRGLTAVVGLQRGRTSARETEPVRPVEDAVVDATLLFLTRHVRGMVEFQRLTGCRPGEACALRLSDVDSSHEVWQYRPTAHKTTHRGKSRTIAIGPRAQKLLREFPTPNPTAYVFSPSQAVEELLAARAAACRTPLLQSREARHIRKQGMKPRRRPSQRYCTHAYDHAVARACDRAFPPPGDLAQRSGETRAAWWGRLTDGQQEEVKTWRRAHRWHPNQLRHSFATLVRRRYGLEAAQVLLGHVRADVTQVYAERNEALAAQVVAEVG
ncbi:site-specific integrase [Limnoglobus roseus]|uniref:Site-specific integrase n=2 Tax=Limnoglobus roseus TaxID=2598579 RepID=A0A5C1APM3_9BACT|nr:site-specific integrase [Limnoglobus roseus]